MKIAIISGSQRKESESERSGRFIENEAKKIGYTSSFFLSLGKNPLPFWDEGVWAGEERWKKIWDPISAELQSASSLVIISPEWSGMVTPALKNFFLLCGNNELAHKPALLVSVSAGIGGSYPIAELRASSYKNTRICYLPDHIIIRSAQKMLASSTPADKHDETLRTRITYSLRVLLEYDKALSAVRESGVIDYEMFPYGM